MELRYISINQTEGVPAPWQAQVQGVEGGGGRGRGQALSGLNVD